MRRFVNGPATQNIAKATWSTAGPRTAGPQNSSFFFRFLIEKSICQSKIDYEVKIIFAKFYKISMFRYRTIDFGCLKWFRMIPGTK